MLFRFFLFYFVCDIYFIKSSDDPQGFPKKIIIERICNLSSHALAIYDRNKVDTSGKLLPARTLYPALSKDHFSTYNYEVLENKNNGVYRSPLAFHYDIIKSTAQFIICLCQRDPGNFHFQDASKNSYVDMFIDDTNTFSFYVSHEVTGVQHVAWPLTKCLTCRITPVENCEKCLTQEEILKKNDVIALDIMLMDAQRKSKKEQKEVREKGVLRFGYNIKTDSRFYKKS